MLRHLGFSHAVCAIRQHRRNYFAFRVRRHHRRHFAVLTAAMRGQAADSGDGKLRLPSWAVIKKAMRTPVLLDGRNIYEKKEIEELGFTYHCIGK